MDKVHQGLGGISQRWSLFQIKDISSFWVPVQTKHLKTTGRFSCLTYSGSEIAVSFFACVFDADDLGRPWRNAAGGRLYAEPRTCRRCRRARRKPSSSRLRRSAVGCKHMIGAARGRGDLALNLGTLSKTTSPVPRLKPPDPASRTSRSKSSLRTQQQTSRWL